MNNIEKKLDALIDALGFDVEELTIKKMLVTAGVPSIREFTQGCDVITYTDYKLTKRKGPLDVLYCGITLRELTNNVMCIQCDPALAKKDKWIAYKKDAYEAVLCWFELKMHINKGVFSFEVFDVKVILDE